MTQGEERYFHKDYRFYFQSRNYDGFVSHQKKHIINRISQIYTTFGVSVK